MKLRITNQSKFDQFVESYSIIDNIVEITWCDDAIEQNKDRFQCKKEDFGPSSAGEYVDYGFSIEMTKEEVLAYISEEIEMNNGVLFATIGQGGSGEDMHMQSDGWRLSSLLKDYIYNGAVVDTVCDDLLSSPHYDIESTVYEFEEPNSGSNPLKYQVVVSY